MFAFSLSCFLRGMPSWWLLVSKNQQIHKEIMYLTSDKRKSSQPPLNELHQCFHTTLGPNFLNPNTGNLFRSLGWNELTRVNGGWPDDPVSIFNSYCLKLSLWLEPLRQHWANTNRNRFQRTGTPTPVDASGVGRLGNVIRAHGSRQSGLVHKLGSKKMKIKNKRKLK